MSSLVREGGSARVIAVSPSIVAIDLPVRRLQVHEDVIESRAAPADSRKSASAILAMMLAVLFAGGAVAGPQRQPPAIGRTVVDEAIDYVVKAGETFETIGHRLGLDPKAVARRNTRWVLASLSPGTRLVIDAHRIVPGILDKGIVVSVAQNRLFLLGADGSIVSMPAAVGRSTCPTPSGGFRVVHKEVKPADVWIGLSFPKISIHRTNSPDTVPGYSTHGCIRLRPSDITLLFDRVEVGTPGVVVDEPGLLTRSDGRIYVEIHDDVYGHRPETLRGLQDAADYLGVRDRVDWPRVVEAIGLHEGFAIDVTAH